MMQEHVIDLKQQIVDLFNTEEMLAFFDFALEVGTPQVVTGLCKISRPRQGKSQAQYYSMLFVIDTPSEDARTQVGRHMKGIDWESLARRMPAAESVLSMRGVDLDSEVYLQGTDVYVARGTEVSPHYIAREVYPAVVKTLGLQAGELVFWEEPPAPRQAAGSNAAAAVSAGRSPLKGLRELLGRKRA